MDGIKKRAFLLFLGGVLIVMLTSYLVLFFTKREKESPIKDMAVEIALEGIEILQAQKGQRQWKLFAEKGKYLKEESQVKLIKPKIIFYLDKDNEEIQIQAPKGLYDRDKETARLWDEVEASYDDITLSAETMIYNATTKSLLFRKNIKVSHPHMSFTSERAVFSLSQEILIAKDNVEVHY